MKIAIKEKETDLIKYRDKLKISFPILIDGEAKVANAFGVWGHPQTFFIDREGKIVGRAFGGKDWTSPGMRALIQHLLSDPMPIKGG